jgi:hypothetical protein
MEVIFMSKLQKRSPESDKQKKRRAPGATRESREGQLVNLTIALAEKQLREGTASSQVMTHFLKIGSTTNQLEQQKLKGENELLQAKVEALKSQKRVEVLYANALNAMRTYSGQESDS